MRRKVLYLISDTYLKPIIKESAPYSFVVKGYCSIEQGSKNLIYTNVTDMLGILICLAELPEELSPIINFLNTISRVYGKNVPVVLWVQNLDNKTEKVNLRGLNLILEHISSSNMDLTFFWKEPDVTDITIRNQMFGTLLKQKYKSPYIFDEDKRVNKLPSLELNIPKFRGILNPRVLKIFSPVPRGQTLRDVSSIDTVMLESRNKDEIVYLLRGELLTRLFNQEIPKLTKEIIQGKIKECDNDSRLLLVVHKLITEGDDMNKWVLRI